MLHTTPCRGQLGAVGKTLTQHAMEPEGFGTREERLAEDEFAIATQKALIAFIQTDDDPA